MDDLHIDDFYQDAAKILLVLYQYFPRPCILYAEDICGPDTQDEYGLHSPRHEACFSAMLWLRDAQLLDYAGIINRDAIDQAVLTHKALTLLTARSALLIVSPADTLPPSIAAQQASHIFQLRAAVKSASSSHIRQLVQHLLNEAKKH